MPHNTEKIRHAYKSKHNLKRKNELMLLMITDNSVLLRGITLKHEGDFIA